MAARRWSERRTRWRLRARDVLARAGVHAHSVALVDEQRHPHHNTRLERGRLVPAARRRVALHARLRLGHGHLDGARHLHVAGGLVDVQQLDLLVGDDPLERLGHLLLRQGELVVALRVHEVRVRAVGVEELHAPRLGADRAELLAGPEGAVDHGAVLDPLELCADERAALARLHVLELEDAEDGAVDLDVHAVLELVGRYHGFGRVAAALLRVGRTTGYKGWVRAASGRLN